jgi:hypothetical protein
MQQTETGSPMLILITTVIKVAHISNKIKMNQYFSQQGDG